MSFRSYSADKFEDLWVNLWFAKGAKQGPVDDELRSSCARLFVYLESLSPTYSVLPPAPEGLPPRERTIWYTGLLILVDQVSRNIFRASARAYATDPLARAVAEELKPQFDTLPVPIRASIVLAYIHSEDPADVHVVVKLLERLRGELESYCPPVWGALTGIAENHRTRMTAFNRIPERNVFLGRPSTQKEIDFMKMFNIV